VAHGSGTLQPVSGSTAADGTASTTLTSGHAAGTVQVRASTGSATASFGGTVTPGPAALIERVQGEGQVAPQGTTLPVAPQVRLADAHGNAIAGAAVTFSVGSGGGSVTGASTTTDASGLASVGSWTLGSATGTNTLVATAGALSVTFTATARASGPARLELVGDSTIQLTAGTALTPAGGDGAPAAPRVRVTDGGGNPVGGVALGVSLTGPGLEAPAVSAVVSDSLGLALIFPAAFAPERAGAWRATVSTPEIPGAELDVTLAVSHAAAATMRKVAGDAQAGSPGTAVPIAPSVQVTDGFGNAVPGVAVSFAVTAGGGSVTGAEASTDSSGLATVGSWTLGTSGAQALTATAGALGASFTATLPAGPGPLAHLTLTVRPRTVTALDSLLVPPPVVHASDAGGAPIPGVTVTAAFVGGGAAFSDPEARTAVTDAAGDARFAGLAVSDAAGTVRLTFTSGEVATDTIEIAIVPAGLAIAGLAVTPSSIRIGGASAQFTARLSNTQASARSALALQGTIVQGAASRAAGGTLLACPAVPAGTLPVGLCTATFAVTASNTASGTGTLVAGPATYRLELRSEAVVHATAEVPVTLLAPEPPPVAGLEVVHGRATGHAGDHLLVAVRAVNGTTPVPGAVVNWSALDGSFEFDSATATSTTDAEGVARMTITPVAPAQLRSAGSQASMTSGASRHAVRASVASNAAIYADLRALVLPEGGTRGWFGGKPGAEDDWDDPENWSDGGPPGLADKVFIPGWGGGAKPKLRGGRGVLDLAIEANDRAGVELNGNVLEVRGNVEAEGGGVSGNGSSQLRLTGNAKTVRGTVAVPTTSVESDVSLAGGTTFGGAVAVGNGGRLRIGGAQAEVAGNLSVTGDAFLGMSDANGYLHVAGNLLAAGGNHSGWLTAGTLQLDGDLTEAGGAYEAFQANNGHVVRLTGGATQVVSFEHAGYSHLGHLEVAKAGGALRFTSDQHFTGGVAITSPTPVSLEGASAFEVQGEFSAAAGSSLAGIANLRLVGNGSFPAIAGTPPGRLSIAADRSLAGDVTLDAPIDVVHGGRLRLNGRALTVNGDLTLAGDAFLQSVDASSTVRVRGNLVAGGGNHSGWLTAGTIELAGNLTESGGAYEAFQSTGSHTVRLVGGANQSVSFQHPQYSRFQNLHVAKDGNVVHFTGAQYVGGALSVTGGGLSQSGSTTFEVSGSATAASGTDLSGIPRLTTRGGFNTFPHIAGARPVVLAIGSDLAMDADATWPNQVEVIAGGRLRLAGRALTIGGDLSLTGDAFVQMVDASSTLAVGGNLLAGGGNHSGWLTAGTLELAGNLTESGGAYEAFQSTGSHTTKLVGGNAQVVTFDHPGYSRFQNLDVAKSNGVNFSGAQYVQGQMTVRAPATVTQSGSSTFEISGGLGTESGSDISGVPNITTRGAFTTFPVIAGRGPSKLTIGSDLTLGGDASFGGVIDVISGGRLRLGGKALSVTGDFTLSGDAFLQMVDATSRLSVSGGFTASGGNHSGWLTAGTLEIGGNFTETGGAYEAFQATGTHFTRFTGSGSRSISFAHDQHSWFNDLEIVTGTDAAFVTNAQVKANLNNNGIFSVAPGKSLVVGGNLNLNSNSSANAGGNRGSVGVGGHCARSPTANVNGNIPGCSGG
jgi:adhesin/invasin